jgi:hypothetical protein
MGNCISFSWWQHYSPVLRETFIFSSYHQTISKLLYNQKSLFLFTIFDTVHILRWMDVSLGKCFVNVLLTHSYDLVISCFNKISVLKRYLHSHDHCKKEARSGNNLSVHQHIIKTKKIWYICTIDYQSDIKKNENYHFE